MIVISETDPHTFGYLIYDKMAVARNGGRTVFSVNGAGSAG